MGVATVAPGLAVRWRHSGLIGRARDGEQLSNALKASPLVTVCGPVGVGKTSLVQSVLPGAVFCSVDRASELSSLWARIGSALGLEPDRPARSEPARLTRTLHDRGPTTLVLDGFDGLVGDGAGALARWIAGVNGLSIVVTSRERLGLSGETVVELGPLSLRDAATLFDRYAQVASPGWDAGASATIVAELVERLDGLPLAIGLAATRLDVLSPVQLLDAIVHGRDALPSAYVDVPPSHRSLTVAIRSSIDGLTDDQRTVLAQAAVFGSWFTLSAARAVIRLDSGASLVDVLRVLRRKSLLKVEHSDRGDRLFCVYETVRRVARVELAGTENGDEIRRRHATYIAELPHIGEHDLSEVEAIAMWAVDVEPALGLRVILAAERCLWRLGRATELTRLFESYRGAIEDSAVPVDLRAAALVFRGRTHRLAGTSPSGDQDLWTAVRLATEAGNSALRGRALYELGVVFAIRGLLNEAEAHTREAVRACEDGGDAIGQALALDVLAAILYDRDLAADQARTCITRALHLLRREGDREFEAVLLLHLGCIALERGTLAEARAETSAALRIHRELGHIRFEASAILNLALIAQEEGRMTEAFDHFAHSAELFREADDERSATWVHHDWGVCCEEAGELDAAAQHYARALSMARVCNDAPCVATALACHGRLAARRGNREEARLAFCDAEQTLEASPSSSASQILEMCRAHLDQAQPVPRSDDAPRTLRVAERILRAAWKQAGDQGNVVVDRDARAIRVDDRLVVSLVERPTLWRIFLTMCERRDEAPGVPVDRQTLFAAGWPEVRIRERSAAGRVRSAIYGLRQLGLRDTIASSREGYLIDPSVHVDLDGRLSPE